MQNILINKSKELGLDLKIEQANLLLKYLEILQQWNQVHNLCAKTNLLNMLGYHILDSLSVVATIKCSNKKILDVGTGAGLPGIPLAIMEPSANVTLLDSKEKKIIFLRHVVNQLQLKNVNIELIRIDKYDPIDKFEIVISRAFSSLEKFVQLTHRLIKDSSSKIIAMKSDPKDFAINSPVFAAYKIKNIKEISVPLVTTKRCLIIIKK